MPCYIASIAYFFTHFLQPIKIAATDGYEACPSQRGTMIFCMLIDLQSTNLLPWNYFYEKQNVWF
jgi:hypothetical protein